MENGRMMHVLIEDVYYFPNDPAKKTLAGYVTIYADAGMAETIQSIEGVRKCYKFLDECTYHVYLDPRYDRDVLKAAIKAAVTGESSPAPDPAPALDAGKITALINDIAAHAYGWGYHSARAAPTGEGW